MARTRKLQWVLYPSFLAVIAFSLLLVGTYTIISVRGLFKAETENRLRGRCALISELVEPSLQLPGNEDAVKRIVLTAGRNLSTRVTLIASDGTVVVDSQEDASRMDNHADRPEVIDAIVSGTGQSTRQSPTQDRLTVYMARAIERDGRVVAVVRVALLEHEIDKALVDLVYKTILGGLIAALMAAFLSWLVSRRVAGPVEEMARSVNEMVAEGASNRLDPPAIHEFSTLASAMNQMADGLRERLAASGTQQKELETIVSGMSEAVLLLDPADRIRLINPAGQKLLRVDLDESVGRSFQEVVKGGQLHDFMTRKVSSTEAVEEEISLESDKLRFVHAFRTAIPDDQGGLVGTLLVLHDITRMKRLEDIRRDFVANVSHELKTPITSIKGFVETLRSGSAHDPDTRQRFLDIIARHTDRLNSIIEDLLVLSRIEQAENVGRGSQEQDPGMARENTLVRAVLEAAVMVCESRASSKAIELTMDCSDDIVAWINQQLMEQAVVNLVDNAVKYSDQGSSVVIAALVVNGRLVISVADNGCGIPREDQTRIFERFYRVDKGRSRAQGGTGLGLSIVRHVATLHGGKVRVTSEPGVGSTFVIDVPAGKPEMGEG